MDGLGDKLKKLRKQKGLSLRRLADIVNCSPSYLSMIENGKLDPTISRLKTIAEGLDTTIRDLFKSPNRRDIVIRKADRQREYFPASKLSIEILVPQMDAKYMDARLAVVEPGGGSEGDYRHPGEEFGLVIEGDLELTVDGVTYKLRQGDSFYFPSTLNHNFHNPNKSKAAVVWVNCPPSW